MCVCVCVCEVSSFNDVLFEVEATDCNNISSLRQPFRDKVPSKPEGNCIHQEDEEEGEEESNTNGDTLFGSKQLSFIQLAIITAVKKQVGNLVQLSQDTSLASWHVGTAVVSNWASGIAIPKLMYTMYVHV